jgi:hypothetical protein
MFPDALLGGGSCLIFVHRLTVCVPRPFSNLASLMRLRFTSLAVISLRRNALQLVGARPCWAIGIGGSHHDCAPATPHSMRARTSRFVRLRFIPDVFLQAYQNIESPTQLNQPIPVSPPAP